MTDPILTAALVGLVMFGLKWLVAILPFSLPISDDLYNAIAVAIVGWFLSLFVKEFAASKLGLRKRGWLK